MAVTTLTENLVQKDTVLAAQEVFVLREQEDAERVQLAQAQERIEGKYL